MSLTGYPSHLARARILLIHMWTMLWKKLPAYLWAAPTTALAIPFLLPLAQRKFKVVDGVLEIHGGFATWFLSRAVPLPGGASAMTLGHIVIGRDAGSLEATRSHERIHVQQAERWGPLFVPAYLIASLIAKWKGGDAYRDNCFEREAYANE